MPESEGEKRVREERRTRVVGLIERSTMGLDDDEKIEILKALAGRWFPGDDVLIDLSEYTPGVKNAG